MKTILTRSLSTSPSFASLAIPLILASVASCSKPEADAETASASENAVQVVSPDVPVLPVKPGDTWRYSVQVEIPSIDPSSETDETRVSSELIRQYIGKVKPANNLPEVDCFEVTAPNISAVREFVEIKDDSILMRGSLVLNQEGGSPSWLEPAVPFVIADMKAGDTMREIQVGAEGNTRNLQVVAREEITVPAGEFPTIRLLMTGHEGELELRRTIWFAFGTGIIREEKVRYGGGKLLVREIHELLETTITP